MTAEDPQRLELHKLLEGASQQLRADFEATRLIPHRGVKGEEREEAVKRFLNEHMPRRFKAVSGFILDQNEQVSGHEDVIIYDHQYAPTYRYSERSAIVPNDAVAAVVEVKSRLNGDALANAMQKAHEVKALVKSKQGVTMTMDDRGCLQETSEVEADGLILTKVFLFAYESDLSIQGVADAWHKHYLDVPLTMNLDEIIILDRGVIVHYFNDPRLHPPTALAPHSGALGWGSFMGSKGGNSILAFPQLEPDQEAGVLRYSWIEVTGMFPGSSVWLGITELGQDSLDFFFRSLLRYLQLFRRVIVTPHHRGSNVTGIRTQALPLAFAIDPEEVKTVGEGEALFRHMVQAMKAQREAGLGKYVHEGSENAIPTEKSETDQDRSRPE